MESWPCPLPMITIKEFTIRLEEETVIRLQAIDKPLTIISIAGAYRTGKSYLMNRLVGKREGFPLGNTVQAETKGIWVWYRHHPYDPNKGLLLMDTEGLEDPTKEEDMDMQILTLCILLSSTFIYNVIGKLDNSGVDKLDFVTELSKHLRVKSDVQNDSDFDSIFPKFVLVCRDKMLEIQMDGREVTADEYMNRVMLIPNKKKIMTSREKTRNETKLKLRRYFPHRKCFFFPRPATSDRDMLHLEELTESELQEEFLIESQKFCSYVNNNSTVKKLATKSVNGRIFVHLAKIYTDAMNDDAIPCIASALTLVSTAENTKLVAECSGKYNECMSKLELPMEEDEFEKWHKRNHKIVVDYFASKAFLDEGIEYHKKLQTELQNTYIAYVQKNWEASNKLCNEILDKLFESIQKKLKDGFYYCRKGYEKFGQDSEDLQNKYNSVPNKGVLANVALEKFLIRLQKIQNVILTADEELTKKEQELEEERLRLEDAQFKQKIEREKLRQLKQHQQQLISLHEQQIRTIEKKLQEDLDEDQRKNEELNRAREAERRRLNEEKLAEEAQQWHLQLEEQRQRDKEEKQRLLNKLDEEAVEYEQMPRKSSKSDDLNELRQGQIRDRPQPQNRIRTAIAMTAIGASCALAGNPAPLVAATLLNAAFNYFS